MKTLRSPSGALTQYATAMIKNKKDFALYYQSIGLSIIPTGPDKKPLITWKPYQERCATREEIEKWWTTWPNANPALVTGKVSGVVALDLDKKHNRTSKEFSIPVTVCAKSGSGGEHFFFKYPKDVSVKSGSAICGEGVDSRADGGYILLAPSVNAEGGEYEWLVPIESKEELAEMPEWFLKLVTEDQKNKKWLSGKDGVSAGSRNDTATSMAGKIISSTSTALLESIGWEQFKIWNTKNTPPLPDKELRNIWESIKKHHTNKEEKDKNKSQADMFLEDILAREDIVLFHDEQNDGYISLEIEGHQEIRSCKSKAIKNWISHEIYRTQGKAPGSEVTKNILAVLEGKARYEGTEIKLNNRAAWRDNELWYDLTNQEWQAVKINKDGWEIIEKPPILFKRYSHHKTQVLPIRSGDASLFLKYVNVTNPEHRLLLLVSLISCFIPDFPHVMPVVFGAQGSSKSTVSKLQRRVVDPSLIEVASFPHSLKDLIQILAHHYFLFFDNVSFISEDQSDILCKAITGGGHSTRELYTDDEDIIRNFMRSIGINGINLVTTRPDLLERSLLLELERIDPKDRKTEKELYENFEKDLPAILGGIFDVLVRAIELRPTIKLTSHPRMADWTIWGCAIAEALKYTKKEFLIAYENNINRQTEMLVNENIVANAINTFMEDKKEWKGTPSELLEKLSGHAMLANIDIREKYWPKGSNILSRRLNELSTPLKQVGISITISTSGTERSIHIHKTPETKIQHYLWKDDGTDDIITKLNTGTPPL